MTSTAEVTTSKDAKTLTSQHILEVVTSDSRLNFLKDVTLKSCSLVSSNNGSFAGHSEGASSGSSSSNSKKNHEKDSSKLSDENDDDLDDDY